MEFFCGQPQEVVFAHHTHSPVSLSQSTELCQPALRNVIYGIVNMNVERGRTRTHYYRVRPQMAHRKWKGTKQLPSMLPGPAMPGCRLVSFHFLWAILWPHPICFDLLRQPVTAPFGARFADPTSFFYICP